MRLEGKFRGFEPTTLGLIVAPIRAPDMFMLLTEESFLLQLYDYLWYGNTMRRLFCHPFFSLVSLITKSKYCLISLSSVKGSTPVSFFIAPACSWISFTYFRLISASSCALPKVSSRAYSFAYFLAK